MCKLAASVNLETKHLAVHDKNKINKVLEHLLYVNSFGQTDGTGMMCMTSDGKWSQHKRALPSPDFINTKYFQTMRSGLADMFCTGLHTRYSTVGGNSDENSHPFKHSNIILMQNGTIGNKHSHANLVAGKRSPCEVDSDSVAWAIAEQGHEKTFDTYEGAGVFMWMDVDSHTFNIVKNDERTLFMAKVKDKEIFIFATEQDSLLLAFTRANLGFDYIRPVKDNLLHTWHFTNGYSQEELTVESYFQIYTTYNTKGSTYAGKNNRVNNTSKKSQGGTASVGKSLTSQHDEVSSSTNEEDTADSLPFDIFVGDCSICSNPIHSSDNYYNINGYNAQFSLVCCDCQDTARNTFGLVLEQG